MSARERVVYLHDGDGEPAASFLELLSAELDVHVPELPPDPRGGAAAVLDAADAVGPSAVVGASGAAGPALRLALAEPERVAALVLLAPEIEGELEGRLHEVAVPTLAVFGTEDAVVPPETGRAYRAAIPGCTFVLLWDAGHELALDRPEALAELVVDFVRRRETFVVGVGGVRS